MANSIGLNHWADIVVLAFYFVSVFAVGIWAVIRSNRGNIKGYFLAGRSMCWYSVGASLFSSNVGSEHFVGLAGAGAVSGIALAMFEFMPGILLILLGWIFIPVYISAGVYTLPEYLEKRFGGRKLRVYLSCYSLVQYILTKLAVSIFSGALFIQIAFGWDMYTSVIVLLVITGTFTILGGLTAVMYTDTFQTVVMMIGACVLTVISFIKVGGIFNLIQKYPSAIPRIRIDNSTCGYPRSDAFHLFRDPVTGDYPWPGIILQASLGCVWYMCCDQVMVQRSLAAKNICHAKGGSLLASSLKILPIFLLVFPGMISRVLFPDEIACVDPDECSRVCGNPVGCSNIAYPKLVMELLPVGFRGFLMAVILSAIMTSLTSIFNSASTLFAMDLWRRFRSEAEQRELLIVGRLFIVVLCGISVLWIPIVKSSQSGMLFAYIAAVDGYFGSPLGAVFLLALFWKRTTEKAAFVGLIIAHISGATRLILEMIYPAPLCGEADSRPHILSKLHFLYFGFLNMLMAAFVIVVISFLTTAREKDQLVGLTWRTRFEGKRESEIPCEDGDLSFDESVHKHDVHTNTDSNERVYTEDEDTDIHPKRKWERIFDIVCGLRNKKEINADISVSSKRRYLYQSPRVTSVLNCLAVLLICVFCFLIGFFR